MKRRIKICHKLYKALDLPQEALFALKVTMIENENVLIENHGGIIAYDTSKIRLRVEKGVLYIDGDKLVLMEISPERMLVEGRIDAIGFDLY